jgi:chemosensory pili system protein ChpA (sensor histidine kinase/response regulator)
VPKPIGVAGATVLGDGRIMPIRGDAELIDLSVGRIRRDVGTMWDQGEHRSQPTRSVVRPAVLIAPDDSITECGELLSMTFNKVGYRVERRSRRGVGCESRSAVLMISSSATH